MADRIATRKRSVVKALTYRVFIIFLDFTAVYLLTGETKAALGFMIISNIYTTIGYFEHLQRGRVADPRTPPPPVPRVVHAALRGTNVGTDADVALTGVDAAFSLRGDHMPPITACSAQKRTP